MNWISIKKQLPPIGKYVLIHHTRGTWVDDDDNPNFVVAKLCKKSHNHDGDMRFDCFGPGGFEIEEVDYWCEFDKKLPVPNLFNIYTSHVNDIKSETIQSEVLTSNIRVDESVDSLFNYLIDSFTKNIQKHEWEIYNLNLIYHLIYDEFKPTIEYFNIELRSKYSIELSERKFDKDIEMYRINLKVRDLFKSDDYISCDIIFKNNSISCERVYE